jgi:hypothetical protein
LGIEIVRFEFLPLIPEDVIEVYHEPLYYEHYLVKKLTTHVDGPVFWVS